MDLKNALLEQIASDPGDEMNWLVLADWLEERGELQRAELTRLSLQLRRAPTAPERLVPEARLRQLVAAGFQLPLPRRKLPLAPQVRLEMVLIPPGSFLMGSPLEESRRDEDEGPQHLVTLSRPFWLGVYPVTQEQWQALLPGSAPGRFRGPDRPVDGISWNEALEFLVVLSSRVPGLFRLPTEAEWEYACRGLTSTAFSCGEDLSSYDANFDGNWPYGGASLGPWLEQTSPVGSYPANAFGLCDMHGNVWEWCQDWFAEDYYARSPQFDPFGPATGTLRVLRGGSWYSYSWSCRSAGRERFAPESGAGNYGMRVVMEVEP